MSRSHSKSLFAAIVFSGLVSLASFAGTTDQAGPSPQGGSNLVRMGGGAEIECIAPDGSVTEVIATAPERGDTATSKSENKAVACSLQTGETNFVVAMPAAAPLDRLTFVNENATACGELTIAVSDCALPAKSPKWIPVEGAIHFANKRAFDLSLLGVQAKYVRLCFRVEKPSRIAAIGL